MLYWKFIWSLWDLHTRREGCAEKILSRTFLNITSLQYINTENCHLNQRHIVLIKEETKGSFKKTLHWDCQFAIHKILFTLRRPQVFSWSDHVSNRKFRWAINEAGDNYFRSREKSLLKKTDVKKRLEFCKNRLKKDGCT